MDGSGPQRLRPVCPSGRPNKLRAQRAKEVDPVLGEVDSGLEDAAAFGAVAAIRAHLRVGQRVLEPVQEEQDAAPQLQDGPRRRESR